MTMPQPITIFVSSIHPERTSMHGAQWCMIIYINALFFRTLPFDIMGASDSILTSFYQVRLVHEINPHRIAHRDSVFEREFKYFR